MSKFESYTTTVFGRDIFVFSDGGGHQSEYIWHEGQIYCVEAEFSGYTKEDTVQIEVFGVATPEDNPEAFEYFERGRKPPTPLRPELSAEELASCYVGADADDI